MLRRGVTSQRRLTTVLFTDIVASTEHAARLGDHRWRALVARHHALVREQLRRFHGREVDTAGDGFFATFEQPVAAIHCATAIIEALSAIDLRIRASVHTGEVEVMDDKVGGITVHVAARTLEEAGPGETPRHEHGARGDLRRRRHLQRPGRAPLQGGAGRVAPVRRGVAAARPVTAAGRSRQRPGPPPPTGARDGSRPGGPGSQPDRDRSCGLADGWRGCSTAGGGTGQRRAHRSGDRPTRGRHPARHADRHRR